MTVQTLEQANAENQLKASLNYAEQLFSQLRSHRSKNNRVLRDLAMLICSLLERERAINRGEAENDAVSWAECVATLTSCVAYCLGCNITITPSENPPEISYYEVGFTHPERGSLTMRLQIPAPTSVAAYAHFWELRIGAKLHSIRPLTEEEWQNKPTKYSLETNGRSIQGLGTVPASTTETAPIRERNIRFSPEECMILDRFEAAGALAAFGETQSQTLEKMSQAPTKDMEKCFLGYLRSIVPYKASPNIEMQFAQELGGEVKFFQSNSVVMVLSSGEVRRFVPLYSITSTGNRASSTNVAGLHIESKTPLTHWNKTRSGYVPPDQHLFLESLYHASGDYGREMREMPIRPEGKKKVAQPAKRVIVEEPTVNPPFDLSKARFTQHALERFADRFPNQAKDNPEQGARKLLARATEDGAISKVGYVRRTIDSGFEEARYFRAGRCRFVVKEDTDDGTFKILTIEYAYL